MSSVISPQNVMDGLIFYYSDKSSHSWRGKPTTNLLADPIDLSTWGLAAATGSLPTRTGGVRSPISDHSAYRLMIPNDGTYPRMSTDWTPSAAVEHTGSVWLKGNGASQQITLAMFRKVPWNLCGSPLVVSLTQDWQRYDFQRTPLDTTTHVMYIGSHDATKGMDVSVWRPQLESGSVASPFVIGGRSSTDSLRDLVGGTTITLNTVDHNTDGSFSFSAGHLGIPNLDFSNEQTIEQWLTPATTVVRSNPYHQSYGGYGTLTYETSRIMRYYWGDAGTNASPYTTLSSSATLPADTTVCCVITRDVSTVCMYLNGVLHKTRSNPHGTLTTTTAPITIGKGYAGYFHGDIHITRLYNRALPETEVRGNYLATKCLFGV